VNKSLGAIVLGLLAGGADAGAVEVDAPRCGEVIHVRAQDAPLGEVLAKVAGAVGFRLDAKVELAGKVTLDRKGPPERLLKELLQGRNLVIHADPSKACGGKERITTVWVLPVGQDGPPRAATPGASPDASAPQAAGQLPPGSRNARPRGTRKSMSEEEWQQMKQDYKAGKVKADPETGKPVPVEQEEAPKAPPEAQ
jgi:hypothetical protein